MVTWWFIVASWVTSGFDKGAKEGPATNLQSRAGAGRVQGGCREGAGRVRGGCEEGAGRVRVGVERKFEVVMGPWGKGIRGKGKSI